MKKKVILFTLVLSISYAFSTIINVPSEFSTIQEAIDASTNGDTVLVQQGEYFENINFSGKNITVTSNFLFSNDPGDIANTTINGNSNDTVVRFVGNEQVTAIITGFSIVNGSGVMGGGIFCNNSSPTISYNIIRDNQANFGGGIMANNSTPALANNTIVQNTGYGIRIANSTVNCTSCILYSNEPEQCNITSGSLNITFSDVEDGYEGVGNISDDPLFTDDEIDNFTLQTNSPCINLGDPFLQPDPDGTRNDMGALYSYNNESSLYADFYSSETTGEIPFSVQFYDNSQAFNTDITDHTWQFSENDYSLLENPSFTFVEPGFYDISLTVDDGTGNNSEILKEDYICATAPEYNGPIWYVSNNGSDQVGNGSVLYPFMTIQNAINIAEENDIIIIEEGSYQENLTISSLNLVLASRYFLSGDESYIENTVLDGNYNGSVLSLYGAIDSTCIVSGLKMINGFSGAGGGIYCENAAPKLASLIIEDCEVNNGGPYSRGGGIYCNDSELIIENSIIRNNTCQNATYLQGGGMYANSSNISVRYSDFSNNQSEYGGGIYLHNSEAIIINTRIEDNEADINAAGVGVNVSNAELINCVITGNVAMEFGGAICGWDYADIILTNCTLTENTGVLNGGGLFFNNGVTGIISNSILWENIPEQIYYHPSNSPNQVEVKYSCFTDGEGGIITSGNGVVTWLAGNIEDDPEFLDSGEHPYQLYINSPCIDSGSTEAVNLNLPEFDILGNFRFWDGDEDEDIVIDMGAYEYSAPQYQDLIVDPITLEFYTYEECSEGLTFSVVNNNQYELDIYDITQGGNFGDGLAIWGISNFDIELPYEISPDEELEFNVEVGLPVEELRDILIDHIYITTEYGQQHLTLLLDGNLITSLNENDIPNKTQLLGNYPNPFNPETVISYQLAQDSYVEIEIFNIKGQCIRTLVEGEKQAGTNEVIWSGRNSQDQKVCSGIYFYRMEAGDYVEMKRMVLLK
jgi:hypothetical protein